MKLTRVILAAALATVAACGHQTVLKPAAGQPLPVRPMMARSTPTPNDLLAIPTYAKPDRVDELMKRSEPRPQDPFDLPPATGGSAPSLPPNGEGTDTQPAPGMPVTTPPSPGD